MLYVLMTDFDGEIRPVGVVSTEEKARAFITVDPKDRDYIPFNLDEIVGIDSQTPGEPEKPSSLKPALETLNTLNDSMARFRDQMKSKPNKKSHFKARLLQE